MRGAQDAYRIGAEFIGMSVAVDTRATAVTTHYTALIMAQVKANASGRPGPRAITGEYRRSINMDIRRGALGTVGVVGTNAAQGRRLELGFSGTDSMGRSYNQPPFPHFGPAVDKYKDDYVRAIAGFVL